MPVTRYVRFRRNRKVAHAIHDGDAVWEVEGDPLDGAKPLGPSARLSDVELVLPVDPQRVRKILGIAGNYRAPGEQAVLRHRAWFPKFPTSLNPHEGGVELPPDANNLNYEGELVLVIGKACRHVPPAKALDYVWGVTAGNDFSENTWTRGEKGTDGQARLLAKVTESWACLYSTIVTGIDYSDLGIEIRLNDDVNARGRTSEMHQDPAHQISYLSHFVTLQPYDLIYTGTPATFPDKRRAMQAGDVVEVEIEGIGTLRNRIVPMKGEEPRLF